MPRERCAPYLFFSRIWRTPNTEQKNNNIRDLSIVSEVHTGKHEKQLDNYKCELESGVSPSPRSVSFPPDSVDHHKIADGINYT